MIASTTRGAGRRLAAFTLGCLLASVWPGGAPGVEAAATTTFINASYININDINIQFTTLASLYPSPIVVSGLTGTVTRATVTLRSLTHTFPADIDILVVGPAGQKVMLMSDVGGGGDVSDVALTFDDAAASLTGGQIVSGTFKPTNLNTGNDTFFAGPAPAGPYGAALSAFNGTNPNGTWRLFVVDHGANDSGNIATGWSLTLVTSGGPAPSPLPRTTRVSVSSGGVQGNDDSHLPAISGDGRIVVFDAFATNLASPCTSGVNAVYAHDRTPATTTCVSVGPGPVQGDDESKKPQISSDGRFVVFYSRATNLLGPGVDTNGFWDVFVYDRNSATVSRVSVSSGGAEGDADSLSDFTSPAVSGDGRFVAFRSQTTNLAAPCNNGSPQIFVRDRLASTTTCVSVNSTGTGPSNGNPLALEEPKISADGRFVAFRTNANNVVAGCANGNVQVYLRTLAANTTECISVNDSGVAANSTSLEPRVSATGRFVAFQSDATNLSPFCASGGVHIYVRDRLTATTACISINLDGAPGNNQSLEPYLSADGRFVLYSSRATNLALPCTNGKSQIMLFDRLTGITRCASAGADDSAGNGHSFYPKLSADGRFVTYYSAATNLVPGDTNGVDDIFVTDMQLPLLLRGFDFDGDARADLGVYRTPSALWLIRRSTDGGLIQLAWGSPFLADVPVAADYDGDGVADIAVYRGATGEWFIRRSSDGGLTQIAWGSPFLLDAAVPGDYDGDGKADLAVYRLSSGDWLIRRSSDAALVLVNWGSPFLADVPVPADYDGDGQTDIAVYRTSDGSWLVRRSSDGGLTQIGWGSPILGDAPLAADYDGDGKADLAVYRRTTGEWFIRRSSDGGLTVVAWGSPPLGDVPVPADYDGDGKADLAVFRTLNGLWLVRRSSDGGLTQLFWGAPVLGDVALPRRF